jgi:hypothetical protein
LQVISSEDVLDAGLQLVRRELPGRFTDEATNEFLATHASKLNADLIFVINAVSMSNTIIHGIGVEVASRVGYSNPRITPEVNVRLQVLDRSGRRLTQKLITSEEMRDLDVPSIGLAPDLSNFNDSDVQRRIDAEIVRLLLAGLDRAMSDLGYSGSVQ